MSRWIEAMKIKTVIKILAMTSQKYCSVYSSLTDILDAQVQPVSGKKGSSTIPCLFHR
jgi:hypothetical protein